MRRFIFWAFFLRFHSVFCVITISTTGPVLANVVNAFRWTREDGDLEVLPIYKWRPGQSDDQGPVVVVDTASELSGTVNITFSGAAKIRQLVIKDLQNNIVAQTATFSVLNPDGSTDDSSSSSQQPTSTVPRNGAQNTSSSRQGNGLGNPAVLGSVIAAGAVVTIILVMLLLFYWRLRRRRLREAFLRTEANGYGDESSRVGYSDFQDHNPVDLPPQRPVRTDDPEDDLYYVPPPKVALRSASSPRSKVNGAAGRVHSHQASLTLISPSVSITPSLPTPSTPRGRRGHPPQQESPALASPATSYNSTSSLLRRGSDAFGAYHDLLLESPTLISPATSYNSTSLLHNTSDVFGGERHLPQESPTLDILSSYNSPSAPSPSVLLNPPPRSGSMDSKRYLAYVEAQRERAASERPPRTNSNRQRRNWQENPGELRTSWQEVSDPPPSYPGHSNL